MVLFAPSHLVTSACTLFLVFKFCLTILIQGGKRFRSGTRPPEDAKLSLAKGSPQHFGLSKAAEPSDRAMKAEADDVRWQRIVLNDLENIPLGLIVAWSSLLSPFSETVHSAAILLFTVGRTLHTYSYARMLQPARAIVWVLAILSTFVMAINGFLGLLFA